MNLPSEYIPVVLIGLLFCGIACLAGAALLVIALVPSARPTVRRGLEKMLDALVALADIVARVITAIKAPQNGNKKPPA